jgi:hypothetical protein
MKQIIRYYGEHPDYCVVMGIVFIFSSLPGASLFFIRSDMVFGSLEPLRITGIIFSCLFLVVGVIAIDRPPRGGPIGMLV